MVESIVMGNIYFKFWRVLLFSVEPLICLFCTSRDAFPVFQSQKGGGENPIQGTTHQIFLVNFSQIDCAK